MVESPELGGPVEHLSAGSVRQIVLLERMAETGRDWEPTRKIEIIIEIPLSALLGAVLFVRAVDTILDTLFLVILIQTFITTALHWLTQRIVN